MNALWNGELIQKNNDNNEIDCESTSSIIYTCWRVQMYRMTRRENIHSGLTSTLPGLMYHGQSCSYEWVTNNLIMFGNSYQNFFRIVVWLFFLIVYSQAGMNLSTSSFCSECDQNSALSPWTPGTTGSKAQFFRYMGNIALYFGALFRDWRCVPEACMTLQIHTNSGL